MAPRAIAAATGNPASATPAHATAAVVSKTKTTASETKGTQIRNSPRGGMSKAESNTAGATNKAKASCGWMPKWGANGNIATQPPTKASIDGYGTSRRRASCSKTTAMVSNPKVISNSCMRAKDCSGTGYISQSNRQLRKDRAMKRASTVIL